jgi:ABC-three component (ABC-3C) system Middle Component 6
MILPTKHISTDQSLLGVGAIILVKLGTPRTVTGLWENVREHDAVGTFERFVLALDLLYIIGVVRHSGGMIVRNEA